MDAKCALKSFLLERFGFLTETDIGFFEPWLIERTVARDELLLESGRFCREMSFVVSGLFRMYCISEGKEINVHFFAENEFMAEFGSLLCRTGSRYSIQALEPSLLVSFSQEALLRAYDSSKNWERLGRIMAEQFAGTLSDRLEQFLFMDGMERYRHLMREQPSIFNRVPLYHLASYLGMERESLSRIRKRLASPGRM